jgi:cyclopropane fatty-acyl-phospholipid synthase-like methyltransferase
MNIVVLENNTTMNFWAIVWVILLGAICLSMIVFVAFWSYAFFRANANPTISTFSHLKDMMKDLDLKPWSRFIDLWCGNGSTLRRFSSQYPTLTYAWIDINMLAIRRWKVMISYQWLQNIQLKKQDIYTVDLTQYDVIYCFLMPSEMNRIQEHFNKHLTDQHTVICAAFKLPDREPTHTVADKKWTKKIFVYKK